MLRVVGVRIEGFRGIPKELALTFDRPVVLLVGENHQGKSSVLNAVEWCLFGDTCIGAGTGMRERIGWEVVSRGQQAASAELRLQHDGGEYKVHRRLTRTGGKKGKSIVFVRPDGSNCEGEMAEEELARLIRSTFRDFFTSVYQHQEAIRAILVQEPRDRNDAIDRLLGLSDYRNVLDGMKKSRIMEVQREIAESFAQFQRLVESALKTRENDLREKRVEARDHGLIDGDMTEVRPVALAGEICRQMAHMAASLGVAAPAVVTPTTWREARQFAHDAEKTLEALWKETPEVREQGGLFERRASIEGARIACVRDREGLATTQKAYQEFIGEHGSGNQINEALREVEATLNELDDQIRKESPRAKLVQEGITLLEAAGLGSGRQPCPLCGKEVDDLLRHLKEDWEERIRKQIERLEQERSRKGEQKGRLEKLLGDLKALENNLELAKGAFRDSVSGLAKALGRELAETDDPVVIAHKEIGAIDARLSGIKAALQERQERAGVIRASIRAVNSLYEVLILEDKKRAIEQIGETDDFRRIERLRDCVAELVDDFEALRAAIADTAREEAKTKINAAAASVDAHFRRIAANPAITKVQILVEPRPTGNDYQVLDQNGNDLNPILSQGDLNCLALALFFGLAEAAGGSHPFDLVMLDDPGQSLGTEQKRRLTDVLNEVAGGKLIVIATMDQELRDLLEATITKTKAVYSFGEWHPTEGPRVTRGR